MGTYTLNMVNLDFFFPSWWVQLDPFFQEKTPFVPFASFSFFFFFFLSCQVFKKSPPTPPQTLTMRFIFFPFFFSERGPDWAYYYMMEWPPSLWGLTGSFPEQALLGPFRSAYHSLGSVSTLTKWIIHFLNMKLFEFSWSIPIFSHE